MRYLSRKADYNFVFFSKSKKNKKAVIIGANQNGRILAESIFDLQNYSVYCFFDEDKKVIGRKIFDLQVFDLDDLEKIVEKQNITDVFLSISIKNQQFRKKVIKSLSGISVRVQSIPNFFETIGGNLNFEDFQELDINDILGRDLVHLNKDQLNQKLSNKSILITGAGGSIGSELCKQIIIYKPRKLIIFEQSEYSLYEIHKILQSLLERISANISKVDFNNSLKLEIIPILGSVQDYKLLDDILKFYKPEIVYHAAAYKHVPLVERNVSEGIKNNIFGSLNIALASINNNVEDFVLVSTDKAVRPTNIMGASKRFAELILQALSNQKLITYNDDKFNLKEIENNTNFCIVRFGNVLGSSGSVFPLFKKQIKDGGPLTLTDLNVTRYFMSIDEATKLVIQSSCMNTKKDICEIYVLHMGDPVKIYDLAKKMIRYSGLTIKDESDLGGDIEIKLIGLRPGEKLFEELLIGNNPIKTKHEKIFKAREDFIEWKKLKLHLFHLNNFINTNDENKIFKTLKQTVIGFNPQ